MKLLKIATSLPLLLAAPLLMAASQVELYGIVDGGLYVKKTSGKDTTIGINDSIVVQRPTAQVASFLDQRF